MDYFSIKITIWYHKYFIKNGISIIIYKYKLFYAYLIASK